MRICELGEGQKTIDIMNYGEKKDRKYTKDG